MTEKKMIRLFNQELIRAQEKALENIDKWGFQDIETLLLALMEEVGEVSQAWLKYKHEHGALHRVIDEVRDTMPLLLQITERWHNKIEETKRRK